MPPVDLLHLLWGAVSALMVYVFQAAQKVTADKLKKLDKRVDQAEKHARKQGKRLAKHDESLDGVHKSLEEVKVSLASLNEKMDRLTITRHH